MRARENTNSKNGRVIRRADRGRSGLGARRIALREMRGSRPRARNALNFCAAGETRAPDRVPNPTARRVALRSKSDNGIDPMATGRATTAMPHAHCRMIGWPA